MILKNFILNRESMQKAECVDRYSWIDLVTR